VRQALAVRRAADLPRDRFSPARRSVGGDGSAIYVRARCIGPSPWQALCVLTVAQMRWEEVVERLHQGTGLSRRLSECVAHVRSGRKKA